MMMMTPQQYVTGTHYTSGRRETKWSKIPCRREQRDERGVNPEPPYPEFEVLTSQPPRLHVVMRTTLLTENVQPEMSQFVNNMHRLICINFSQNSFKKPISITK